MYSDLTGKILVFWKSGRSREVVARGGSTVSSSPHISVFILKCNFLLVN